jgi:hypothetical protein
MMVKEALLTAAGLCGQDGRGKGELVGYLRMLATKQPAVFARLLIKVLPTQIDAEHEGGKLYTPAQAAARMRERGLPIPPTLQRFGGEKPS